jgi:hypothetical protein
MRPDAWPSNQSHRLSVTFYYGHGSWLFLVVFAAFFVMRILPARRRRGRARTSAPATSFTNAPSIQGDPDDLGESPARVTFTGIPPGWLVDPSGRHEKRYWSGSEWSEHVTDGGVPGIDPPPGSAGREASP